MVGPCQLSPLAIQGCRHVLLFYTTRAAQVLAVTDGIQINLDDRLANDVQDENEEGARTKHEPTYDEQHSDSGEETLSFEQLYERARQAARLRLGLWPCLGLPWPSLSAESLAMAGRKRRKREPITTEGTLARVKAGHSIVCAICLCNLSGNLINSFLQFVWLSTARQARSLWEMT